MKITLQKYFYIIFNWLVLLHDYISVGIPSAVKKLPANAGAMGLIPGSGGSPREGNGNSPVFLPRKFNGQRGLVGCSPWGCKRVRQDLVPAAATAKSLQSCPTLCEPIDGSPPGFPVPGILQARTLEWGAISLSNAWKWKVKVKLLSRVRLQRPHGLQPTRLLHPRDFPGRSTGVGCHWRPGFEYIHLGCIRFLQKLVGVLG